MYNRYRYYDPGSGRFISKDPIGLEGGLNAFQYAPNPVQPHCPLCSRRQGGMASAFSKCMKDKLGL
nr:RHS repeat-associated core domain-containing protein [Burkholderia ubonensis]